MAPVHISGVVTFCTVGATPHSIQPVGDAHPSKQVLESFNQPGSFIERPLRAFNTLVYIVILQHRASAHKLAPKGRLLQTCFLDAHFKN